MPRDPDSTNSRRLRTRTVFEWLLAVTLIVGAYYLIHYVPKHVKAGQPVLALTNYFLTYAPIEVVNQPAYVLPDSVVVWDTPAEIRAKIAMLQCGDQVQALGRFRTWTHVRMVDGHDGWVSTDGLMDSETHQAEERLHSVISGLPAQAAGHASELENIHIEPSRQAPIVAQEGPQQGLEIFSRRLVQRSEEINTNAADALRPATNPMEVWYLVQAGSHTGWILGRRVQLDFPKNLSAYAQDTNLVAWVILNVIDDNGQKIPQYVVADRMGSQTCDFTDVEVLTWWKKKQTYAIAYKERELQGYFPILVSREGSVPYFRLRLIDDAGNKYQKVYALYDTITRSVGTVDTWVSDATPQPPPPRIRKRRGGVAENRQRHNVPTRLPADPLPTLSQR